MRQSSLLRFYVLMFMEVVAANMVHPVTPTFLATKGVKIMMHTVLMRPDATDRAMTVGSAPRL